MFKNIFGKCLEMCLEIFVDCTLDFFSHPAPAPAPAPAPYPTPSPRRERITIE